MCLHASGTPAIPTYVALSRFPTARMAKSVSKATASTPSPLAPYSVTNLEQAMDAKFDDLYGGFKKFSYKRCAL